VSIQERWARSTEQIKLMNEALARCRVGGWCGRALDVGETAYIERFLVGEWLPEQRNHGPHQTYANAPNPVRALATNTCRIAGRRTSLEGCRESHGPV
jgi:hypothetical protein